MKIKRFRPAFVPQIPEIIDNGVLYVCLQYNICVHKCACGCGEEVITPIDPNEWKIEYNGESMSLSPSIGNWRFKCRSHYWIKNGEVLWMPNQNQPISINVNKHETKKKGFFGWLFNK